MHTYLNIECLYLFFSYTSIFVFYAIIFHDLTYRITHLINDICYTYSGVLIFFPKSLLLTEESNLIIKFVMVGIKHVYDFDIPKEINVKSMM